TQASRDPDRPRKAMGRQQTLRQHRIRNAAERRARCSQAERKADVPLVEVAHQHNETGAEYHAHGGAGQHALHEEQLPPRRAPAGGEDEDDEQRAAHIEEDTEVAGVDGAPDGCAQPEDEEELEGPDPGDCGG
ncbi:hypothetical protein LTR16_009585, partial [Cryomyces antarcticus]